MMMYEDVDFTIALQAHPIAEVAVEMLTGTPGPTIDASGLKPGAKSAYAKAVPEMGDVAKLIATMDGGDMSFSMDEIRNHAHVTLTYSREATIDVPALMGTDIFKVKTVEATVEGLEYWDGHNNAGVVVLKLKSDSLATLNSYMSQAGAKHSYDDFVAHMTVCAKVGPQTDEVKAWIAQASDAVKGMSVTFTSIVIEDLDD